MKATVNEHLKKAKASLDSASYYVFQSFSVNKPIDEQYVLRLCKNARTHINQIEDTICKNYA